MEIKENIILTNKQIDQKIRRIAYQIYETNFEEDEIVVAGIANNGYILAEKIVGVLNEITNFKIHICKVTIDKKNPLNEITVSMRCDEYKNKSLVLVDDVLHSGATLMYSVKHFLEVPLKRFKTAVLVNRNHKKYPIKADYKGISLSTSINENVIVKFNEKESVAFLS